MNKLELIMNRTTMNTTSSNNRNNSRNNNQIHKSFLNSRGMTLLEIMIVLGIIAAITAVLANKVGTSREKARVQETKLQMNNVLQALEMYSNDCGRYPEALIALRESPGSEQCPNWGPDSYVKKEPKDAWNHEFAYSSEGGKVVLKSLGKDGREGGEKFDKDISSEDL
jgi:general secretion pathway protein G